MARTYILWQDISVEVSGLILTSVCIGILRLDVFKYLIGVFAIRYANKTIKGLLAVFKELQLFVVWEILTARWKLPTEIEYHSATLSFIIERSIQHLAEFCNSPQPTPDACI